MAETRTSRPGKLRVLAQSRFPRRLVQSSRISSKSTISGLNGKIALNADSLAAKATSAPDVLEFPVGNPSGAKCAAASDPILVEALSKSTPIERVPSVGTAAPSTIVPFVVRLPATPAGHSRWPPPNRRGAWSKGRPNPIMSSRTQVSVAAVLRFRRELAAWAGVMRVALGIVWMNDPPATTQSGSSVRSARTVSCSRTAID